MHEPAHEKHEETALDNNNSISSVTTTTTTIKTRTPAAATPSFPISRTHASSSSSAPEAIMLHPNNNPENIPVNSFLPLYNGDINRRRDNTEEENVHVAITDTHISTLIDPQMITDETQSIEAVASSFLLLHTQSSTSATVATTTIASDSEVDMSKLEDKEEETKKEAVTDLGGEMKREDRATFHHHSSASYDSNTTKSSSKIASFSTPLDKMTTKDESLSTTNPELEERVWVDEEAVENLKVASPPLPQHQAQARTHSSTAQTSTIVPDPPRPPPTVEPTDFPSRPSATISMTTNMTTSMSSTTITSSSSSSLSEFLLIGQEQVEKDSSEYDLHSERSYDSHQSGSQDSFGDNRYYHERRHDGEEGIERPQSAHSFNSSSSPNHSQDEYDYEELLEDPSLYRPRSPSHSQQQQQQYQQHHQDQESGQRRARPSSSRNRYTEEDDEVAFTRRQQRITYKARPSSMQGRASATPPPSPPSTDNKTRKRRSYRASVNDFDDFEEYDTTAPNAQRSSSSTSSKSSPPRSVPTAPILPALKVPSVKGLGKTIFEFVLASVVCLSLISCMFAFSYITTGTTRLLGWYSDQKIGQRIRDGFKEREHFVQETLEKMAGEEYAKVKRRSQYGQQYQQQQQQQQQQQHRHQQQNHHQHQNRYQQQYQQERDARFQQQQQQKQGQHERGRLSPAEWQELIRAASMSFMAKFSTAPSVPGLGRR
ncbi:hypothetical protein BGZ83_010516 [Gryganskiella cystojenkinii]|nr:hypothetical protein BGZ83_010516 [Gryganskiella cystojenkinii]